MRKQTTFIASLQEMQCPGLGLPLPLKNQTPVQSFFLNEHFHYNPYSYYHQYWRFPYDYHFSHQFFDLQQNHSHEHYINQQSKIDTQVLSHSLEAVNLNIQKPAVKVQLLEEVEAVPVAAEMKHPKRKYKMHKKHRKNNACYYWSTDENRRYSDFLSLNAYLFSMSLSQKKNMRVNVMMSKKVKTRTPQQCHSHHQKMMKKYGSIASIVDAMKRERQQSEKKSYQGIEPPILQDQVPKDHIKEEPKIDQ